LHLIRTYDGSVSSLRISLRVTALIFVLTCSAACVFGQTEDEEFTGPFPSWTNLKRDYGSDGAALQRALNEVGTPKHSSSLFIPAGTYCVQQLEFTAHLGVSVVGEDPATTVLKYCGAERGVVLHVNGVAYSRLGRLTFDCGGVASVGIDQSYDGKHGNFDTGNEYSDVFFRNCPTAIRGGNQGNGFAETTVLRAHFGPSSGPCVIMKNFNALDLWIWYSRFDHCQTGVTNDPGAGNFNVYNSVFRESVKADIYIHNTGLFNIRNNTSVGSNAFWATSPAFAYPALTTIQGNKLIHVAYPAILIRNQGPALIFDNQIESPPNAKGPAIAADALADTDLITAGNVFTTRNPVAVRGRNITLDDRFTGTLDLKEPSLPGVPRDLHRRVFEVPVKGGSAEIQQAIDAAVRSATPRAIVHIPEGSYGIKTTLEIPRGSDVQIVGDGVMVTRLQWISLGAGPVFHVAGPSKAIFREIFIGGGGGQIAESVIADGIDQPGSRVHLQQVQLGRSSVAALLVDGLDYTHVDIRNIEHQTTGPGVAIKVVGGKLAAAGNPGTGRTNVFSGASSNNQLSYELSDGGRLMVRDIWYEGPHANFIRLTGTGTFTLHGARLAIPAVGAPAARLVDFHGSATFLSSQFDDRIETSGDNSNSRLMVLGFEAGLNVRDFLLNNSSPGGRVGLLSNREAIRGGSSVALPDRGPADPAFLREMLAQTRAEQPGIIDQLPAGVSDLRFYRVAVGAGATGIHLKP